MRPAVVCSVLYAWNQGDGGACGTDDVFGGQDVCCGRFRQQGQVFFFNGRPACGLSLRTSVAVAFFPSYTKKRSRSSVFLSCHGVARMTCPDLFHGREVALGRPAEGTDPIFRNIFKSGSWLDSAIWISFSWIIHISTQIANILLHVIPPCLSVSEIYLRYSLARDSTTMLGHRYRGFSSVPCRIFSYTAQVQGFRRRCRIG